VEADDLMLRITATAICGSDLHLYRGKMPGMKEGDVLGHEFMGIASPGRSASKARCRRVPEGRASASGMIGGTAGSRGTQTRHPHRQTYET
jgi:threonine dehydrogenase-like Zn-dependent dehydrogenase